jgi:hypothetical protein
VWGKATTLLGPLERTNLNHWTINLAEAEDYCRQPASTLTLVSGHAGTHDQTWSDNKVRELMTVKVLHTSLLSITVVAFKVYPLRSYAPMSALSVPFKTILELVLWNNTGVPGSIPGVATFFWAAVGLERGPFSLVNNLRSYLEEIVAAPGLETRSYGRRDSLRWPSVTLYPLKLALASLTGGDRSIGIVR